MTTCPSCGAVLAAAFKEGRKMATDCTHIVACHFDADAERLSLSVRNVDTGAWSAEVPMKVTRRPRPEAEVTPPASVSGIGFNADFILDAIAVAVATGDGFLRWEMGRGGAINPWRIAAEGADPEATTVLVMPIRLD